MRYEQGYKAARPSRHCAVSEKTRSTDDHDHIVSSLNVDASRDLLSVCTCARFLRLALHTLHPLRYSIRLPQYAAASTGLEAAWLGMSAEAG